MINLVFIFLGGALLAGLAAGLIYAFKRLSRPYFLVLLLALIAAPCVAFKTFEKQFMLGVVPAALGVTEISYSQEESWGFGPGGNEAGIRTYPLPEDVANAIAKQGLQFFETMPPNLLYEDGEVWRRYKDWRETPIVQDKRWIFDFSDWSPDARQKFVGIYLYICNGGFCFNMDPAVVAEANAIVFGKGSYYAYGRTGLIVVSPGKKQVLYMYRKG